MESIGKIAVIVPHISSNTDTSFISMIHTQAASYGYDTIVISGVINYVDEQLDGRYAKCQTNIYDLLYHGDFDGYIFDAGDFCSGKQRRIITDILRRKKRPCVAVNYEQPYFPSVSADETLLLRLAARHLINEHGCKKLYCIGGNKGDIPSEQRISGFKTAMDEAGAEYDESCIFYGSYWRDIPHQIALDIAGGKTEKPDGIVCGSDIMAVEVCRTLEANGIRVPEDIKVTGCDGSMISRTERVSVTTVAGQSKMNALLAVRKLLRALGNDTADTDMSPELVTGESCGCTGCSASCTSLSDIREYAGTVFELIEHRKTSSHGEMLRRMSECKGLYDVTGTFLGCCYMIPTGTKAELCLCSDWCRSLDDPSVYRRGGLSDKMLLAIEACYEGGDMMKEFSTGDVFPSLKKTHEPRLTVVSSLHYKGQIFGYVGFTYRKAVHIVLDDFYMNWCDCVCTGLNAVQNRMYKDHVNKRIESLSEFAPILGVYNKRGLISKLMNIMAENSNAVLTLTLLSYIKEERVHYSVPPVNSIVNALRLKESDPVLACINDDIIACVKEDSDVSEQAFVRSVAENVRFSYHGAVEIKQERIAAVTMKIQASEIFAIDDMIKEMEDKLRGRIISICSGSFSYKDRFTSLRDDISRCPEKDWNIESITRSMGLSKTHFHRIYRELFASSCKEDIIAFRIEKAKWLLENTSLPVSHIAEQCGYSNNSHFIRQFSSHTGSTPSDYRKQKSQKSK